MMNSSEMNEAGDPKNQSSILSNSKYLDFLHDPDCSSSNVDTLRYAKEKPLPKTQSTQLRITTKRGSQNVTQTVTQKMHKLSQRKQQKVHSTSKEKVIPILEDKQTNRMKILKLLQIYEDLTIRRDRGSGKV